VTLQSRVFNALDDRRRRSRSTKHLNNPKKTFEQSNSNERIRRIASQTSYCFDILPSRWNVNNHHAEYGQPVKIELKKKTPTLISFGNLS